MRRCGIAAIVAVIICGPAVAKSEASLHTAEETARVRALCQETDWAITEREKAEKNAARWVDMPDEELWDFILDADVPRALNVNFGVGCPIHGTEVHRKGGHYPWVMSTDEPFKVKCPVGNEVYPSNDFAAYLKSGCTEKLDTTQPYVDDGYGYVAPDGKRYWFVGYYIFWQRWRKDIFGAMDTLNHAYLLTGDAMYAHKLGVMLGRLAEVYPKMDYAKQAYHNGQWPADIDGRVLDYIWENGTINRFARCYDGVYDAIDRDEALKTFLAERGITDLKRRFEQDVLHFMARDIMEGRIRGNMYYQPTLALLARVIDNDDPAYGPTTKEMVDWLLYGGGEIETILYNGFDRDGAGGESAVGYSSSWNTNFCKVAEELVHLGYALFENPRWRQVIRFPYNVTLAGQFCPRIGDCHGDIHRAEKLLDTAVLSFGYKHFQDPQCAQLLLDQDVFGNALWGGKLDRADVERIAASAPGQTDLRSRDLGGYGLAVFDAGEGDARRAATLYYGSPDAWHGHHDRLTISYHARGRDFLTEMGYPAHWNDKGSRFTRGMPCHYIVEIDQKCSRKNSGYLDFFAAGENARVVRAHAEATYPGLANIYQRTFAMIDIGDDSFLIDHFHVKGGALHDYHFHGMPFGTFMTTGLEPVAEQKKGTLLGEDVTWGGDASKDASGYDFLRNVRRYSADGVWSARWAGRGDCRLTYFMPPFPEIIVCDGEPPYKPDYPETMEFIVARNRASESRFPAVIVPSHGSDPVRGVRFESTEGNTVYHVETADARWRVTLDDAGRFSAECAREDGYLYAFHANQRDFDFEDDHFALEAPSQYTILAVDYARNRVQVHETIAEPALLTGEAAVIAGGGHSASYTIAEADAHALRFEGPAITGMLEVAEAESNAITTSTRLTGFGTQIAARAFPGRVLLSEDNAAAAPITGYANARFTFHEATEFHDANQDGRTLVYMADFAPGYTITITPWAELTLSPGGQRVSRSNLPLSR